ncbi:hypothetical protein [Desertivirga xinjiangensis]|uniref:hypothetical protein n=1 Tax=Desertivirga xinjiangensis TaxID=539206 RepID=UPI00210C47FB|nr:hypothetical protein [Pedobacter xinjiangensis]
MKLKLSPLNILTSVSLVSSVYLLLFPDASGWRKLGAIPLLGVGLLSFIIDVFFKTYIKDIKRIWIVELAFLIFAAVLLIFIRRI